MAIAFWEHFCPEKDFGICIGAERLLYFFEDMANGFAIFFELIIIQSNIYQTLILEFICGLTVYNPSFEQFFCNTIPLRHLYIEQLIANETFTYIDQNVYDHIEQVAELFASFARLMIREGLDYFGRTLIFLVALGLIFVKYIFIGATIVTAFFLAVITGMIYSSFPPEVKFGFNTTTTFEEAYDIMQDKLVTQLLQIDAFKLYNDSKFPCPPGVCDLYKSILIQVNETLHSIYLKVPIIFMWVDLVSCYAVDIKECGHKFGICELFFGYDKDNEELGKQNGLIFSAIYKILNLIISTPDYICILWKGGNCLTKKKRQKYYGHLDPKSLMDTCCSKSVGDIGSGLFSTIYTSFTVGFLFNVFGVVANTKCALKLGGDQFAIGDLAECFVYELLDVPRAICEKIVKPQFNQRGRPVARCVCDTCPIDLDTANEINTLIKPLPIVTTGVPCNPFGNQADACCVGGSNYRYWTDNCEIIKGGKYKSIFWGIYSLIFYGDTTGLQGELPFRCEDPLGYIFFLLERVVQFDERYFGNTFEESLEKMIYYYDDGDTYDNIPKSLVEPFVNFNSMDFQYAYFDFHSVGYEKFLEDRNFLYPMYREHRNLMYSLTTGCYGPHFLAYYYTNLYRCYSYCGIDSWKPDILGGFFGGYNYNNNPNVYPTIYDDYDFLEIVNTGVYEPTGGQMFRQAPYYWENIGIKTFELDEVTICPLYRKMKTYTTDFGFSEFDLGTEYLFLLYNSMVKELREVFFSSNINNAFINIVYDRHEYRKRDKFIEQSVFEIYPQEIRPSVFYEILEQNKTTFLNLFVTPTVLDDNKEDIMEISQIFDDVFRLLPEDIERFCTVFTIDHGYNSTADPKFKYRLNENILYSDMGKSSFYNFFVTPYFSDPTEYNEVTANQIYWDFLKKDMVILDYCENVMPYISLNAGIRSDFADPSVRSDVITNEILNNIDFVRNITNGEFANVTFEYEEDFLEEISKQYLVVKVMKEKYFPLKFMNNTLYDYLSDGPCSAGVYNPVSFYEEPQNDTLCEPHIPIFKLFFDYFIKHDPHGWYKLLIDNEKYPENICIRKDVVEDDIISDINGYVAFDYEFNTPQMIPYYTNDSTPARRMEYNYFATIIWNFIERLNMKTSYDLFQNMDFDLEEASRFCAEAGVVFPRLGMELPKTECLFYMAALKNEENIPEYTEFAEDFFNPRLTNCDIVSSFLTKVFNFGWKKQNGDYYTKNEIENIIQGVDMELDCNEIILERISFQEQNSYVSNVCDA